MRSTTSFILILSLAAVVSCNKKEKDDDVIEAVNYEVGSNGPAGGKIFYENPTSATDGWTYLEAAPSDIAGGAVHPWGKAGTTVAGTLTAIGKGEANTALVVAVMEAAAPVTNTAAQLCDALTVGGQSDWFLPSRDELNEMYDALELNNLGSFESATNPHYWTSSEQQATQGYFQWFSDGYQANAHKGNSYRVRCVRAF